MTDNGFSYIKNRSLRELLNQRGIRHLTTQPYRPRTNGKVERFHQTMAREWAYGLAYRTHRQRNKPCPHLRRALVEPAVHANRQSAPDVAVYRTVRAAPRRHHRSPHCRAEDRQALLPHAPRARARSGLTGQP
jgi:transposase InsO family protein